MYSDKQVELYKKISEKHRQSTGPWPLLTEACCRAVQDSASPRILDLASGPGEPAIMIARAIPNAHVIASDNDPQMISLMKEAQDVPHNLMIQLVDMQNLDLYADESFDAVTCCYGIMFPPDKVKMFAEIHRVLKAGGTFLCTYWTNLRVNALREAIMQQVLQGPVPPRNVNPLYFKEPGLLENMLKDSNFGNFETIESSYDFSMGPTNDEETLRVILFTTVDQVDELQAWDTARNALEEHKTEYGDVDSSGNYVVRDNTFKLLVATKLLQR